MKTGTSYRAEIGRSHGPRLLAALVGCLWIAHPVHARPQGPVTEIIEASGDGAGNGLEVPRGIAVSASRTALELSGRMIVRPLQPAASRARGLEAPEIAARRARAAERLVGRVVEYVEETDEYIVRLLAGETEETYAERLLRTGDYEYAEPDWLCRPASGVPDDPAFPGQWHHAKLESTEAWTYATGDASIVVAIVDGGVATDHPDLAASLVPGYNASDRIAQADGGDVYDVDGHGTFIAGCAAAIGDNGTDVVGVGWNLSIMPVRYYNNPGGGFLSDLLDGARWAVDHGARSINVSQTGVQFASVQTTGAYIRARGGLLVYAAGNDGADLSAFDWPDVIVVGGTDQADALLSDAFVTSAHGQALDVFAPGADILSTGVSPSGTGLAIGSGTSASTALVSGLCGLLWSIRPEAPPDGIEAHLTAGCVDLGAPGEDGFWGWGRISSRTSVALAAATGYGCGVNPPESLAVLDGLPSLGTSMILGLDNPLGTQAPGAIPLVAVALAPDPSFPCGTPIPGLGMAGAAASGEVLVSLAPPNPLQPILTGTPWGGPGSAARVTLDFPLLPGLVGSSLFVQGVLADPTQLGGVGLALTGALDLRVGP